MWYLQQNDMLEHLPAFYGELEEVCIIAQQCNEELDALRRAVGEFVDGWYVEGNSQDMLANWEQVFHREENWKLPLERRKLELLACFRNRPPVNTYRVVQVCLAMLGEGSTLRLDVDEQKFICYVKYRAKMDGETERRIRDKVRMMIPANLLIELAYDYNEWQQVQSLTWNQVAQMTWTEILTVKLADYIEA